MVSKNKQSARERRLPNDRPPSHTTYRNPFAGHHRVVHHALLRHRLAQAHRALLNWWVPRGYWGDCSLGWVSIAFGTAPLHALIHQNGANAQNAQSAESIALISNTSLKRKRKRPP